MVMYRSSKNSRIHISLRAKRKKTNDRGSQLHVVPLVRINEGDLNVQEKNKLKSTVVM